MGTPLDNTLPQNQWTEILVNDVAPAGAATVRFIVIMGCSSGGAVFFDDASLIIGSPSGGNVTVDNAAGQCNAQVTLGVPNFSDNCPGATITNDYNNTADASDTYPVGTTTVTWTVTDAVGLTAQCTVDVTVNDTEDPSITCPSNISTNATSPAGAVVTFTPPTGTDNCPSASTIQTGGLASGATFPIGTTTNTFTT